MNLGDAGQKSAWGKIATDAPQARFWIASCWPTIPECTRVCDQLSLLD